MAYRKIVHPTYVTPKEVKPGTVVVKDGVYMKVHNAGVGRYGDMISHHFLQPDGSVVAIPDCGDIQKHIRNKELVLGKTYLVTLAGKVRAKDKKGVETEFWKYDLEVDDDATVRNPQDFPDTTGPSPSASSDLDISL